MSCCDFGVHCVDTSTCCETCAANTEIVKERFWIYRVASEMVFQSESSRAERVLR